METVRELTGALYFEMMKGGALRLGRFKDEMNALNVFPIPDGDTGDNMLFTLKSGLGYAEKNGVGADVGLVAKQVAKGMLLYARGNSGVILSQFFEGVARGLEGAVCADAAKLGEAFLHGVRCAYEAVMTPVEGTVLTVMREGTDRACGVAVEDIAGFLRVFSHEAKRSLSRTPELLPVLKSAGVVDSGGAGFICIIDGMLSVACGEEADAQDAAFLNESAEGESEIDAFTEDSVLELGYCTELLVRIQRCKTAEGGFDAGKLREFLDGMGDSVALVLDGSLLKLHVHTFTPHKVLEYCQGFGEFLKVKIENMSLQHGNAFGAGESGNIATESAINGVTANAQRKKFGVLAVACGEGLKDMFVQLGADIAIDGGQCTNPSVFDILDGVLRVNAETVFVLPNNGNIILTAKQAAEMCNECDVRVLESRNIGDGYAAISAYSDVFGDADEIYGCMRDAMADVVTANVSRCVRDSSFGEGVYLKSGDFIGFSDKKLLAFGEDRGRVLTAVADSLGIGEREVVIVIAGEESSPDDTELIREHILRNYRGVEVYSAEGGQPVYDYIIVAE